MIDLVPIGFLTSKTIKSKFELYFSFGADYFNLNHKCLLLDLLTHEVELHFKNFVVDIFLDILSGSFLIGIVVSIF